MRQGFRVIDSDTHVNPSLDVLLRYADEDLKARIDDLQPYRRTVKTVPGRGDAEDVGSSTILSVRPVRLQRVAGQKSAPAAQADGDRGFLSGRTQMVTRQPITPRVAEDNARGRLRDMDLEGRDIDFIIPGPWAYGAPALAPHLAQGLYRAYHRYMADYCAADSRRLKSMILALATDPVWSAQVIKEHAREDWVAAVWPLLPEGMPIDDPDLEPIWAAADEADLPIMYHAFTVETPYFPGYRDIWDNPAMGRCAGQTWGGQRFLSFMLMGGMLDRYPRLRIGSLESGHGWLERSLRGHAGQVLVVAFSPNAHLLVTGGTDGMIQIWDAASGQSLRTLRGHTGAVKSLAFHPDGKLLATAGTDKDIRVWDLVAGKAGGQVETGRHLMFPALTPMGNLFLSILQLAGSKTRAAQHDPARVVPDDAVAALQHCPRIQVRQIGDPTGAGRAGPFERSMRCGT